MNIPKFIGSKNKADIYASFVAGRDWIQAGLWQVENNEGVLLSIGTTSPWQDSSEHNSTISFIDAADDSLSSAIGALGNSEDSPQLTKVVFGLSPTWIESGKVNQEKLLLLRELCEKLELTPSGFVVIPEALVYMIRQKEGGAGSFILVGLDEEEIEITVVQAGKLTDTQRVARSIALGDDITEGLTRINSQGPMPARIILHNRHTGQLTEAKQELISWEWPHKVFLHTPRIELLPTNALITAVSEAAAMEVAHVSSFRALEKETHNEPIVTNTPLPQPHTEEEIVDAKEFGFSNEDEQEEEDTPQDEAYKQPITEDVREIPTVHTPSHSLELDGLPSTIKKPYEFPEVTQPQATVVDDTATEKDEAYAPHPTKKFSFKPISFLSSLIPRLSFVGTRIKTAFIILFLIAVLTGAGLWYIPKAQVTIFVAPKQLEETIPLIITAGSESSDTVIAGKTAATNLSGEKTTATSGRKTIGDKAKGEVIIINNTPNVKAFLAGTMLNGPNTLRFTLDQEVRVASESGAPLYKPGEARGQVTALNIGVEYNLTQDTVFSIANFSTSSFSARNATPFTGGSSRQVAAVDKLDQDKLEKDLSEELKDKAIFQLSNEMGASNIVIEKSAKLAVISRKFSAKSGEEAEMLSLKLDARISFLTVSKEQLHEHIKKVLASKIPTDFALQEDKLTIDFSPDNEKKGQNENEHLYKARVSLFLVPRIDNKTLAAKISGKDAQGVKQVLSELPGFSRSTIKLTPSLPLLPGMLGRIPKRAQNIAIIIKAEE